MQTLKSSSTIDHSPVGLGSSVSLHRKRNTPDQILIPKIAKIVKKKSTKRRTFVSWVMDVSKVFTIDLIAGNTDSERRGLKSLKVLKADMFPN